MRPESIRQNLVFYADGVGANQKVTIAMTKVGSPVHIYWGDGTECWNTDFTGNITHTYEESGSKKITFLQPADGWERLTSLVISSSYLSRYIQGFKWMKDRHNTISIVDWLPPILLHNVHVLSQLPPPQ